MRLLGSPTEPRIATMPLSLRAPILVVAALVAGCSAPVVDDVSDASNALTDGVVLVERSVAADGTAQTNVSAKFMRLATPADPEIAERVVGSTLSLPPVGHCRRTAVDDRNDLDDRASALSSIGTIELIDVGDVSLRAGSNVMTLAARAFPDVGDVVWGMFYTSRDATSDLPSGASYTLEGSGSAHVDRFSIDADAPSAPEEVSVAGTALGDAPVIEDGAAIVRWRAGEPAASKGPADVVLVDVTGASGASIRCTFEDRGQGTVPAWVWSDRALGALPASASITIHRVRERPFVVSGLDTGAVRFDLSVAGRVTVAAKTAQKDP
jgi:hypothetical protein